MPRAKSSDKQREQVEFFFFIFLEIKSSDVKYY